ncbi:MAG TPA: hypothetical protein VMU47_21730 [Caldimonas sp.]|nr:hypothetical protein [Caldimonas sp.]
MLRALDHATATAERPPPAAASFEVLADSLRGAGERQLVEVELRPGLATLDALACAGSSYVGVGVTTDARTDRIIMVGDDTPASRAGLQHDDIVLNPDVWDEAHRDGALLLVLVLRDSAKLLIPVRVGRICID